jgi:hypothetical protein
MTTSLATATTIESVWVVEGRVISARKIVGAVEMEEGIRVKALRVVLLEVHLIVEDGSEDHVQVGEDAGSE